MFMVRLGEGAYDRYAPLFYGECSQLVTTSGFAAGKKGLISARQLLYFRVPGR